MSSSAVRRVSRQDIQLVQNLIERCLQLYMNQKEVVETLLVQAKIEPGFTELVWQKLEEENREFFKAYYLRLIVKHQILEFNKLLEQQVQLMHQMNPTGVAPMPTSNGSNIPPLHQNPAHYAPERTGPSLKPESMQHPVGSNLPNTFGNGGSSLPNTFSNGGSSLPNAFSNGGSSLPNTFSNGGSNLPNAFSSGGSSLPNTFSNGSSPMQRSMHTSVEMPVHANRIGATLNMLPNQNSNVGLMSGMNGGMIKSEVGYSGNSSYMFGADGNVLETRPTLGDASGASYSSVESNAQPLNDSLLDADSSSFGFLGQIPRNFSLSDLTADFSQSSDILESYPRSPFLATYTDNFLDSRERVEHQGENRRLDTISEGLSYEDFGSE